MSTTKTTNTVSEIINTVENAQKLAKEQENPSYIAMFKPWVLDVSEFQVNELTESINEVLAGASESDDRFKQLSKDFEMAKARFEGYQLKTLNKNKATVKKYKKAVAVAVREIATRTKTEKWFNYRTLYKLGLLDELPAYNMNTGSRLNSQVAKMFTFVQMYAKRSNELVKKEREIAAVMKKYNLPREIAERMYVDGVLKA
jgi:hypothetical protein